MRLLSTQEHQVQHRRDADRLADLAQAGADLVQASFAEQVAVLACRDGAAAGGDNEDVVLQQLGDDLHVDLVLRHTGVVAAHVGCHAADATGGDGLV